MPTACKRRVCAHCSHQIRVGGRGVCGSYGSVMSDHMYSRSCCFTGPARAGLSSQVIVTDKRFLLLPTPCEAMYGLQPWKLRSQPRLPQKKSLRSRPRHDLGLKDSGFDSTPGFAGGTLSVWLNTGLPGPRAITLPQPLSCTCGGFRRPHYRDSCISKSSYNVFSSIFQFFFQVVQKPTKTGKWIAGEGCPVRAIEQQDIQYALAETPFHD